MYFPGAVAFRPISIVFEREIYISINPPIAITTAVPEWAFYFPVN